MAEVLLSTLADALGGPVVADATFTATATRARAVGDGVVANKTITVPVVHGVPSEPILLDQSGVDWCWRLRVVFPSIGVRIDRTVAVPDAPSVEWADLVDVDPATLLPDAGAVPAWTAAVGQVAAALADTETARDGAVTAQGLSEAARDAAVLARGISEIARDGAVVAQGASEDARDQAQVYAANTVELQDTTFTALIADPESATRTQLNATIDERSVVSAADPVGYDVILLAGQSNMSGRGTGYTLATDPEHPMIFQLKGKAPNKGTIIPATEPLDMVDTPSGIGPGFQFARWYVSEGLNRGRKVLLVPTAQGGTPLTSVSSPTWMPGTAGSLADNAISQATIAASFPGSKVVAVLWLQGETDGDLLVTGPAYQSELDALFDRFRAEIPGATSVPIVVGQMVPDYLATGTRYEIDAVHRGVPNRIAYTGFAPSPAGSATHLGDGNHFNAAGYRKIARTMFDVYQRIRVGLAVDAVPAGKVAGADAAAAMVYSLRRVVDNYYGPIVTVRRSSDSTVKNIGLTSAGTLDTDTLLSFADSGDAFVETWYDQSDNGRHIAHSDGGSQPKLVTAGAIVTSGGKPALLFDGVDDHLFNTVPALFAAGKATVSAVINAPTPDTQERWWAESITTATAQQYGLSQPDGSTAGVRQFARPVVSGDISASDAAYRGSSASFDGSIHQITGTDSGTQLAQWVDGAVDLAPISYTRTGLAKDRFTIGGVIRNGSLAPLGMTLSEAVFWTSVLSTADRQTVESNQKTFYGTP